MVVGGKDDSWSQTQSMIEQLHSTRTVMYYIILMVNFLQQLPTARIHSLAVSTFTPARPASRRACSVRELEDFHSPTLAGGGCGAAQVQQQQLVLTGKETLPVLPPPPVPRPGAGGAGDQIYFHSAGSWRLANYQQIPSCFTTTSTSTYQANGYLYINQKCILSI